MRVYVASSWRNEERQQAVVRALRDIGHEVYDFRNPTPGDHGFSWRQCVDNGEDPDALRDAMQDPAFFRDHVLKHPVARAGFKKDMDALSSAEATVLVLPCGRSAHLELGYATGARQHTVVLLDDPMSEPELMYLMNSVICTTLDEVVEAVPYDKAQLPHVVDIYEGDPVRVALEAPRGMPTVKVVERRMTAIRDLVARIDNQDREMAEALLGLFPGDNAVTAVKKLVEAYRLSTAVAAS